jgi:hypothetical protein
MTKDRKYYSLVLRDDGDMIWRLEFGDYSRETVQQELEAYTEHAYLKKNAKIIVSDDNQDSINAVVQELNERKA